MLAGMRDDALRRIVGPGITKISLEAIERSYDHKRHHAAHELGRPYDSNAPVPVWGFVVDRTDGTRARFHPDQRLLGRGSSLVS